MLFSKQTFVLIYLAALYCFSLNLHAQTVSLTVTNIRSDKGQIAVSIFTNKDNFANEKPVKKLTFSKANLNNGMLTIQFELALGTYGLALIDDEDGNKALNKNVLGIPKEGFGFSNFYLSGMKRPAFDDFKFNMTEKDISIRSKLRYM